MTSMAVKQIEFYFTVENLCKDIFIRSYMDEEVKTRLCVTWVVFAHEVHSPRRPRTYEVGR